MISDRSVYEKPQRDRHRPQENPYDGLAGERQPYIVNQAFNVSDNGNGVRVEMDSRGHDPVYEEIVGDRLPGILFF